MIKVFIFIYNFYQLYVFEICYNFKGFCVFCFNSNNFFLVFLGIYMGYVQFVDLVSMEKLLVDIFVYEGVLSCIVFNLQGIRIVIVFEKGIFIRIFDILLGYLIQEL